MDNLPEDREKDYNVIRFYGYKIITDRGHCDIIFRNESNGYYGGYMMYTPVTYDTSTGFTEIIDDWTN
jgi:hypothetical protein